MRLAFSKSSKQIIMNKIQLLGVVILFALASCKKNDIEKNATIETADITNARSNQVSNWTSLQNWTTTGNNSEALITDKNITAGIASEGLVLLYVKSNNSTQLLPARIEKTDLYYQIENGSIQINAATSKEASFDKSQQFSYIIFSKDQLQKIEEKGFSRSQLVRMDYEPVKQLVD